MEKEQEIKEGNRIIAEFMGYIYYHKGIIMDVGDSYKDFQEKEVFSKVPIESVDHPDQCYFNDIPNPDYGKEGATTWRKDLEKLNWATVNCYNYIIDLKYHEDWNSLMEVIDKIHNLEEEYPVVKNNFHIWIMKREARFIYDYDGYCIDSDDVGNNEKWERFNKSSKSYRFVIFDNSPIYATWRGVVDFIEWFKLNNK